MIVLIRNTVRIIVISIRYFILKYLYKMDISRDARISVGVKLDKTHPKGIHVAAGAYVASGTIIFSHDFSRGIKTDTYIGEDSFIGANVIIMPGIKIGREVVVGSGAVVTKNVADNCIVAGNPAKVIKEGINTTTFGKIVMKNRSEGQQ